MALEWLAAQVGSLYQSGNPLIERLGGVSLIPLVAALLLHLAKLVVRARAWHNIVRAAYPTDQLRFRDGLAAFLAGVGVDAVLPAHPGLLVRLGLLRARLTHSTFSGLLSTRLVESAFDAILTGLLIGIAIAIGFGAGAPRTFVSAWVIAHLPFVACAALSLALVSGWLGLRFSTRIRALVLDARRGFVIFTRPVEYIWGVASWQAFGWALRIASVYCFLLAFHLPANVGGALVVVAVQLVAAAIPVTPGGAGPQQAMLVIALSTGADATVLGFGVGMQAATVLADLFLGGLSLILLTGRRGVRLVGRSDDGVESRTPSRRIAERLRFSISEPA
jgi:uncharacterized membrane protein YbhN (UPF0104 family)